MNGISEQKQLELYKKFLIINRSDKKSNNNNHYQENIYKRNQNSFRMNLIEKSPPCKTQLINNIYNINNNANNIQINNINKKELYRSQINKPSFIKNKSNIIAKIRPIEIENMNSQKKLVSNPNSIKQLYKSTFFINKTINIEKLNNGSLTDRNMRINYLNPEDPKSEEFEEKSFNIFKGIYKKRMISSSNNLNKIEKDRIKDKIDIISIPCLNCGNLVEIDKIEKHSLSCFKVSNDILYLELSNKETNNINYKLKKLNDYITNIEKEENSDNIKYLVTVIKEYIEKVLKINQTNNESVKELKRIYKNFIMLNNHKHKKSLNFIILIDRARILVQEKIKIFKNIISKTEISKSQKPMSNNLCQQSEFETRINKKSKELEKINQEMQLEKIKVKNLRDSVFAKSSCIKIKNGLSTYNGNVINITNNRYNNKSLKNSNSSLEISLDNNTNRSFENSSYASIKNKKKKLFFREVIRLKLEKLHNSHRGQKIPPAIIWEKALKNNIPENNWESFILRELNKPQKSENKIRGKSANYSRMSVINEE